MTLMKFSVKNHSNIFLDLQKALKNKYYSKFESISMHFFVRTTSFILNAILPRLKNEFESDLYDFQKKEIKPSELKDISLLVYSKSDYIKTITNFLPVVSGVTATLIHDAISNPTEVIKQRLQMYNSPYKTVFQCAIGVYRTEGFKAFYRSYITQLCMNLPHQTIHFTTYELFQNKVCINRIYFRFIGKYVHIYALGS